MSMRHEDNEHPGTRRGFRLAHLATIGAVIFLTAAMCPGFTAPDDEESGSPDGGSTTGTYWQRNDGAQAWLYFQGSVAKACAGGEETIGTYNASAPSMTYVISGNSLTFPLRYEGDALLVGVPDEGVNTNTATWYVRSNTYGCGSGGGGGGGGGGDTEPLPIRGTIIVRVYPPSGACAKDQPGPYWEGGITGWVFDTDDSYSWRYSSIIWPSNSLFNPYWERRFDRAFKLTWNMFPNRQASMPSSCVLEGSAEISYNGETKIVTLP